MQALFANFRPHLTSLFRTVPPMASRIHSTTQLYINDNIIGSDYVVRSPLPDIELPKGDIYTMVSSNFSKFGAKIGLVDGISGREYSYNELDEYTCRFSSCLQRMGFGKSDVLCIVSHNCPEYVVVSLGILRAGGVVTTCNPIYTVDEIASQLLSSGAKIVTTNPSCLSTVQAAAAKAKVEKIIVLDSNLPQNSRGNLISYSSLVKESCPLSSPVSSEPDDVAMLLYSSGTTGLPKGVMLTNYNINSNLLQIIHPELFNYPEQSSTSVLAILPFFHVYGMVVILLSSLCGGAKIISIPKFEPESFLSAIGKYRINIAYVVPPMILFFAKHPLVDKYDMSSLNQIVSGAAPIGEGVLADAMERTKCNLIQQAYGMTETGPVSHIMPRSLAKEFPSSVGQCVRSVKAKIVDPDTQEALPPNKEGEIYLRGPNVMKGYLNNLEATRECLMASGWLRTGDLGYYDERGLFYVTDRLKELIKVKGLQVAPAELEAVLLTHPKILDAAVIGIPNEILGEAPKAFVVKSEDGLTENEVNEFLAVKVSRHKQLVGGVTFVETIPKSASGKILRRMLKKQGNQTILDSL